jgi:hypothetical protein
MHNRSTGAVLNRAQESCWSRPRTILFTAIDAVSGEERWQRSLGQPVPRSSLSCGNISPLGVTGTPVIDAPTEAIYLNAAVEGASGPRLALTRFAPFSYFCTCWNVSPSASPSFSWLMSSIIRRILTRPPTCLSTGLGAFLTIARFTMPPNHSCVAARRGFHRTTSGQQQARPCENGKKQPSSARPLRNTRDH